MAVILLFLALCLSSAYAGLGEEYNGKESWGYINVRKDAYMFWWLYYTDVADNYKDFPLIIWLQGGPGASSTGFGNFQEIGPYDVHLKYRNTTWVKKANLLFLDNPVGTGYSYVTNKSALCTNNTQIADDLVLVLGKFLETVPEFQKSPLYVFSESYGGKMAADFGLTLYRTIRAGKIVCNFKGVALGDSWISPIDSVSTWGQYLYTLSRLDRRELTNLNSIVKDIDKSLKSGMFLKATELQSQLQDAIENYTDHVSFYNILKNEEPDTNSSLIKSSKYQKLSTSFATHVGFFNSDSLTQLMNGKIREKLHVIPKNVTWSDTATDVYIALSEDFMKPVITSVDKLLNETGLHVYIYSGQLDLICDVLGTRQWMDKLKWPGMKNFYKTPPTVLRFPGNKNATAGFVKSFKNLSFISILNAGHMVPQDAGVAALQMLNYVLTGKFPN